MVSPPAAAECWREFIAVYGAKWRIGKATEY
jgi:hypothetical protein